MSKSIRPIIRVPPSKFRRDEAMSLIPPLFCKVMKSACF